jgi:hypothetical protein
MEARCRCGTEFRFSFDQLGCIECGAPCCPTCSYQLESTNYCSRCAEALLELPWAAVPVVGRYAGHAAPGRA